MGDLDLDGDPDLVIRNYRRKPIQILRNNSSIKNHFLEIQLRQKKNKYIFNWFKNYC